MTPLADTAAWPLALQTDASRAQTLELHIQARVNEELERIRAREAQTFADLEARLQRADQAESKPTPTPEAEATAAAATAGPAKLPPLSLESPRIPFAGPGSWRELDDAAKAAAPTAAAADTNAAASAPSPPYRSLTSAALGEQVSVLRSRLEARPRVRPLDGGVASARDGLVGCLTGKGAAGRPLDCWTEVDEFKREVGRLEKDWVARVVA